ncbi:MAG TPA: hypothetical protein VG711_05100, partial [Phycisphaerales bacterium]|nr:hypothetical protein [Phycisphaerales bacterium]
NLFTIGWSSTQVADVPAVLNAVADTYMDLRKSRDDKMYSSNYDLFKRKLRETQDQMDNLTQEASQFIVEHGVTTTSGTYESPEKYRTDKYSELLASAGAGLSNSETHYNIVSAKLQHTMEYDSDDIVKAEQDITMQSHLSNLMALESELIRLTQTRQSDDMMVQNMKARVDAARKQRDKQRDEIITRNLNAELQVAQQDVERYKRMIEDLEKKGKESTETIVDLAKYQAQYDLMQEHRHSLEETRQKQMELVNELELMRLRADASRVTMAQKAQRPRIPSFPKLQIMVPLGTLLLLFSVTGFIFLREIMDQRVKSVSDLSVIPGSRVIGSIPELGEDPTETTAAEFVIRKHPYSVLAESYRQALSPVLQAAERLEYQTILLAGGLPGAGTTTVVTNLASCATAAGKKVLVIDANFRRPRLASVMDVAADGPGFGDLLVGEATVDEAIAEGPDGISVIGPGRPANRIIDRLSNGKLESILAELRGRFDLILLDAPPIVVAGDALVVANKVDAAMLVVRAHQEHRGCVARVMNLLSQSRSDFLGVLLNRPRGTAGGYLKKNYVAMAEYTSSSAS